MDRAVGIISVFLSVCLAISEAHVFGMGSMIEWEDRKVNNIFAVLQHFNGYGCYCGFGGHGYPVDKVDCCCQDHDECYDKMANEGVCSEHGKDFSTLPYGYKKITEGGRHVIQCKATSDECVSRLCECDRLLADCFSSNERFYDNNHRRYDRKHCDKEQNLRSTFCPNAQADADD